MLVVVVVVVVVVVDEVGEDGDDDDDDDNYDENHADSEVTPQLHFRDSEQLATFNARTHVCVCLVPSCTTLELWALYLPLEHCTPYLNQLLGQEQKHITSPAEDTTSIEDTVTYGLLLAVLACCKALEGMRQPWNDLKGWLRGPQNVAYHVSKY